MLGKTLAAFEQLLATLSSEASYSRHRLEDALDDLLAKIDNQTGALT